MSDVVDNITQRNIQAEAIQRLFAAVALTALDDAIFDESKTGKGVESFTRWFQSKDGREVLLRAGIEPNDRALDGMVGFVKAGTPTSKALTRAKSKANACSI